MFSKRTKKIFTIAVIVMTAIGLIGPGVLLFFEPQTSATNNESAGVIDLGSIEVATTTPIERSGE